MGAVGRSDGSRIIPRAEEFLFGFELKTVLLFGSQFGFFVIVSVFSVFKYVD